MKITSNICLVIFIAWVLIAIADLWFDIISAAMFYKLSLTLGLLVVVALGIALIFRSHK